MRLPVHRFCWASSPDSWAATIACTSHYKHVRHCHYFHQRGSQCRQTPGGCCRAEQLKKYSNAKLNFHTHFLHRKLDFVLCIKYNWVQVFDTQCFTWHRCQLCGHIALCSNLLPAACGKVVPPKLPEQRIVFILWASRLIVVRVVPSEHIQVSVVGNTAMPAAGRGGAMTWRGRNKFHRMRRGGACWQRHKRQV